MEKVYLCIDLKSFYASVECVDRGLDSMTTNLVVADPSRGKGTICLAVSPALKALGVRNRCRVYEIPTSLKYIMAPPRMSRYMEMSCLIYNIYLKYISQDDIHVYSIDECFLDITNYTDMYQKTPMELAKMIIDDVFNTTGIVATCGIGTNLFLAKIALDITAKHSPTRIGYLDEEKFKKELWDHKPITDFWNIASGISTRLLKYNVDTLRGITKLDEDLLYKEFGINAELLIDHAYGKETTTIYDIKHYTSKSNSLSKGQVLFEDYNFENAKIILKEMIDSICLDLVEKHLVAGSIGLSIVYSKRDNSSMYGLRSGGSKILGERTRSKPKLKQYFLDLYEKYIDKNQLIRGINIGLGVCDEAYKTVDLFESNNELEKEDTLSKTILKIKEKHGKNSILKALDFKDKATQKDRNKFIGGHKGG